MKRSDFEMLSREQVELCMDMLNQKSSEYTRDNSNRLLPFDKAAKMNDCNREENCMHMLSKHIVSISDMVHNPTRYSKRLWQEKITDSINYLLLMNGCIEQTFSEVKDDE